MCHTGNTMKNKILIGVGVLVALISLLMAMGVINFKFGARLGGDDGIGGGSSSTTDDGVSSDQVQWKEYKSAPLGFTVSHPVAWVVKEQSDEGGPDVLVSESQGFAFVRIRGLFDASLSSPEAVKASIEEYRNSLPTQQDTKITKFAASDVEGNIGGFIALGEFMISGVTYRFEERGLLATNGRVTIMRAAAVPRAYDLTIPLMEKIMESFRLQ